MEAEGSLESSKKQGAEGLKLRPARESAVAQDSPGMPWAWRSGGSEGWG